MWLGGAVLDTNFGGFGDKTGNKQGTLVTFLADAARTGNCAFLDRCQVERVTFHDDDESAAGRPRASGVVARVPCPASENRPGGGDFWRVRVKARRAVVLSAGALHSPCVLLRSGLGAANAHIGKHLRLHPVRDENKRQNREKHLALIQSY